MFNHKLPSDFPMQTLRKKTSPCKYKNEPGRFLGEGVAFRAKLIGVLEVHEARGDRMCQEALADAKIAIRASGVHKQRIQVHVAIDGLRLRDDKTGDSLYHHPVHKISFIAQDMTDSRAFGYIFGSPDTGHRFFAIKTDKAASQVVIAMRDLFQVVFELKKKEVELAKQHLEGKSTTSSLVKHTVTVSESKSKILSSVGETSSTSSKCAESEGGVAELVNLEQELSSLRRGLTQVEGLTPATDPFGDSFIAPTQKGLLPPPPSGSSIRGRPTPASTCTSISEFGPSKPNIAQLSFGMTDVARDYENAAPTTPAADSLTDELKNPPKKVLKDLVTTCNTSLLEMLPTTVEAKDYGTSMTSLTRQSGGSMSIVKQPPYSGSYFPSDPFAETDPFDSTDPFSDTFKEDPFTNLPDFPKPEPKLRLKEFSLDSKLEEVPEVKKVFNGPLQVSLPPELTPKSPRLQRQMTDTSTIRQRPQPSSKLIAESASPPPLPPKKVEITPTKPPMRSHVYPEPQYSNAGPPLPPPIRKKEPVADRSMKPRLQHTASSSGDEYLVPAPPPLPGGKRFDITLSQLLTCGMDELAVRLRVPASTLSSMTLPQLTSYLRSYLAADSDRAHVHIEPTTQPESQKEKTPISTASIASIPSSIKRPSPKVERKTNLIKEPKKSQFEDNFAPTDTNSTFVANFDDFDKKANPSYDRYAAFREIQEQEFNNSILIEPMEQQNGNTDKEDEPTEEIEEEMKESELSKSPLKSLDELTLDSFNMFTKSVSPKPIDSKIEDIKNVMKTLQIEKARRSVSPRENVTFADQKQDDTDRYAALREITITEPPDEFESLPSEAPPKERKRSDEKSDGFDNSDFFDCIDNSSLSFSHVDDAFRKSPGLQKEKVVEKVVVEEKKPVVVKEEPVVVRQLQPPPRLSTGSLSDVASASSPDIKDKSITRREAEVAGRWSVLAARASPWSSESRDSETAWREGRSPPPPPSHTTHRQRRRQHCRSRQTSSSSRDVSPWEEEPPPPPRHHRTNSRHRDSSSRECLDSGSGRDKEKLRDKRDRERERDHSRDGRESVSTRERDRRDSGSGRDRRDSKDRDHRRKSRDRDREKEWYSRERDYKESKSRERKDYREKEWERHWTPHRSWDDEEDYSDGCGSGRSSPRERWPEQRRRRDDRNYGSLGYRESRRRNEGRHSEEAGERRYGATLSWSSRRSTNSAPPRRESDRRRVRRDDTRQRAREQRFSNDFSPRDREREQSSPFDNDFVETPAPVTKKRGPYSSLEGTRFAFDPEDTTASPLSAASTRAQETGTRFRFDSDSVSPRSMFEDDFTTLSTPRARAASIAEEEEGDLPPLRTKVQVPHKDIKKSDSVNIFVRESDPFEGDDFFACTGSDRAGKRENWPGDFQAYDNV